MKIPSSSASVYSGPSLFLPPSEWLNILKSLYLSANPPHLFITQFPFFPFPCSPLSSIPFSPVSSKSLAFIPRADQCLCCAADWCLILLICPDELRQVTKKDGWLFFYQPVTFYTRSFIIISSDESGTHTQLFIEKISFKHNLWSAQYFGVCSTRQIQNRKKKMSELTM